MDLSFRIEKRESFRLVGHKLRTTNRRRAGRKAIPAFWDRFKVEGLETSLLGLSDREPRGLYGVSIYNTDGADPRKFEYLIAVVSDHKTLAKGMPDGMSETLAEGMPEGLSETLTEGIPEGPADELAEYTVPAMTWAVFPCTLETMGKTEAMAISKWLPKSNYRPLNKGYITGRMRSGAPDIEYYGEDGSVEVWIAVKEKG